MIMGVSLRLITPLNAALAIFILASPAFAQSGSGSRWTPPARIVNPRTSSTSPSASPLDVSGTWTITATGTDKGATNTYDAILNQDQAGNISGSITVSLFDPCSDSPGGGVAKWPVSGAVTGTDTFSFSAENTSGVPDSEDCFGTWQIDATATSATTASATWDLWNDQDFSTSGTMTRKPLAVVLIDPIASGLLDGNAVTQDADAIAGAAKQIYVLGVAADGAAQAILEVKGVQSGDSVQLTLVNENGQQDSAANDGGLFPLGGDPASASSTLTVQAQNTNPPMAIAVWVAPKDFSRGAQDATTLRRSLTIQTKSTNTNPDGSPNTGSQDVALVRPPVVLIHGLWSSGPGTWKDFHPDNGDNWSLWDQMHPQQGDYSQVIPITNPNPAYSITSVTSAALGFSFNAPNVLLQLQASIANYAVHNNVAAAQADVVAHSMGGDISRTMPGLSNFAGQNNYGLGPIHKLITIGTPHTGTPVAVDLLPGPGGDPNACVRKLLNRFGSVSLLTASVNGIPVNGAVGDLRGTSFPHGPFSIAYIAGTTLPSNLAQLNATIFSHSGFIYSTCGNSEKDPLALRLTPAAWNQEFAGFPNDGIVPLASQTNGMPTNLVNLGVIHSPGFEELNFSAPSEVDPESGIPDEVVNLLNEAISGPDFFPSN